jgi:hypothetical protein
MLDQRLPNLDGAGAPDEFVAYASRLDRQAVDQIFFVEIARQNA